ncbi:MAG: T9SS type A sorting domain-containing protein [Saprospiraceae bacterium]|nr:T9SS type A sorting domain-containing protein [Saprospiraceae bacterium]
MKKDRRQFLKNTSLATFTAITVPSMLKAEFNAESVSQAPVNCNPTTQDFYGQGPFYSTNAPTIINNQLALANEPGTRLIISGWVHNLDCTEYIGGAILDIWHANDAGAYDNSGFNLRGKTTSNNQGFYLFETIYPGKYLNGSSYRPAHIHFKITPPGYPLLTTQLYFQGDSDIPNDAAASMSSGTYDSTNRIVPVTTNSLGQKEATWDIVIDGNGTPVGIEEMRSTMGMIYKIYPNPFSDFIEINYGVFQEAKVSIQVFDIQGRLVAILEELHLKPEKFTAEWRPDSNINPGHYFVALKINDVQVDYLKVIKES